MVAESGNAKEYQRIRNWLRFYGLILTAMTLLVVVMTRWTDVFFLWAKGISSNLYFTLSFYFLFFSIYSLLISFPLEIYSGFFLEHRYALSNQTFRSWLKEWGKKAVLSFLISLLLLCVLYALIWNFEHTWWIYAWLTYAFFSLVMGKLFPVLIIPIFYKYSPISDQALKERILNLAERFGVDIRNISSLNLSKTTKKANAAFTGFGRTKRVILSDTLIQSFSHDEIETVLAHELGHYKNHDIWKQFGLGLVFSLAGFWLAAEMIGPLAQGLGYSGIRDIPVFPVLCGIFFLVGIFAGPVSNWYSRLVERQADQFALKATHNKSAFISTMRKLGEMNLADPDPHPLIEFLFYDHPSIGKRIRAAEGLAL